MFLTWKAGGVLLGVVLFLGMILARPVNIASQFVVIEGVAWEALAGNVVVELDGRYVSRHPYFSKDGGLIANRIAHPFNAAMVFCVAMIVGAAFSALRPFGMHPRKASDKPAASRFSPRRFGRVLIAGFVGVYGAHLAGGGIIAHSMSGIMQTAVSGYVFSLVAVPVAVMVALILYRRKGQPWTSFW